MKIKKLIYVLSIALMITMVGCGSAATKDLTMADFTQAYTAAGVTVDPEKKIEFATVYAKDGMLLYMDEKPVKIYEFASKQDFDKAKKEFKFVADWQVKGLFALETANDKAKEIFKNVK